MTLLASELRLGKFGDVRDRNYKIKLRTESFDLEILKICNTPCTNKPLASPIYTIFCYALNPHLYSNPNHFECDIKIPLKPYITFGDGRPVVVDPSFIVKVFNSHKNLTYRELKDKLKIYGYGNKHTTHRSRIKVRPAQGCCHKQ